MAKVSKPTEGQISYMKMASEMQDKSNADMPWYRSYPSAVARGVAQGVKNIGQMFGDPRGLIISENGQELTPEESLKTYGPLKEEQSQLLQNKLEKNLPIGDSFGPRMVERGVRSGVESVPFLPFGGALPVAKSVVGGGLAQGAQELGAPEWAQTGIEIGAQIVPDLSKAIINKLPTAAGRAERYLISEAERLGLAPEEYALTLNQRGPVKDFVQEISAKGGRVVERFDRTRQALSRTWDTLRNSAEAQTPLGTQGRYQFYNDFVSQLQTLPSEQRLRVITDFDDFLRSNMRGEDLINLWQDLNYYIPKGEAGLGTLKGPISTALESISPELAHDFRMTNQLYGNFHRLAERMGPNVAESLIRAGENGIVLTAVTTGNFPLLKKVLGPVAARQISSELSTNPRFMNLASRFISSIEKGSPIITKKAYDNIISEVEKVNEEAAFKMSDIDFNKFYKELKKYNQENKKGEKK